MQKSPRGSEMIFETITRWIRFCSYLSIAGGISVFLLDLARLVFCITRLGWLNFFIGFLFHTHTPLANFLLFYYAANHTANIQRYRQEEQYHDAETNIPVHVRPGFRSNFSVLFA
jgi:hypothetical protein